MESLKRIRENNNLTQTEMAQIIGISVQRYNMYENGKRKLPIDIAKVVADSFKITLDEIFLPYY